MKFSVCLTTNAILAGGARDDAFTTSLLIIALKTRKITAENGHLNLSCGVIWHSSPLSDAPKPQELAFLLSDFTEYNLMCNRLTLHFFYTKL